MATSAITGSNLTNLRTGSQEIDNLALHITPLVSVATGTITSVPTLSPYTELGLTWSGGFSGVVSGQYFVITDSGDNRVSSGAIRKTPTSGTVYINSTPLGSNFYAIDVEQAIEVGDTITVYNHHPLASLKSRIADRAFYKQWDLAYTDENSAPPPVANTGTWQVAQVDTGGTARFQLPRNGSNTSFGFGVAISSYSWSLPAGVSLSAGYALTDAVIEVDAVAGYHLVSLTVTDANANTHTAYVWLFVSDGSTGASLSERYSVEINSDSQTPEGRTLNVTITGDNLKDVLYPGAGIVLREWATFNGSSLTDGILVDTFVGYIGDLSISTDGNINTASLTVESPFIYAGRINQPSQVVQESSSPANWTQATSTLTNPRGFAYYAIKWHSPALLDMHDIDIPYTTPRRQSAEWQAGTLQSALQSIAQYVYASIGSASDGTTVMRKKPVYLSNTDRNALATIMTLQAQDFQAPLQYTRRFTQALSEARSGAFAYDGTSVKAWLVAKRWGQGQGNATLPNFTVTVAEGLAKAKEIVGHFYAEQSREIGEVTAVLTAFQDVIDPAYWLWVGITTASTLDAWGDGFTSERTLCTSVNRDWIIGTNGILKTITLGLQPETFGQPGEELPIQNAASYQLNGYSIAVPTNFLPDNDDTPFGAVPILIVLNEVGELAIAYDYTVASPDWNLINPFINDQVVNDFAIDYNSPYFQNGNNPSYALGMYVVVTSGTQLRVWYFADILNSSSATAIQQVTMSDSSVTTEARIEVSETTPTLVIVAWKDQSGTQFTRSTDGGNTWSSVANIGSSITDTVNDNAVLGLDIDGVNQLISAPNASSEYGAYLATTAGGSFSRLTNTIGVTSPIQLMKVVPDTDTVFISSNSNTSTAISDKVTWSSTDGWDKTVNASGTVPFVRINTPVGTSLVPTISTTGGNPDDVGEWSGTETFTAPVTYRFIISITYLTGAETDTLNNFTLDYYISSNIASDTVIYVETRDTGGTADTATISSLTADAWTSLDVGASSSLTFPVNQDDPSGLANVTIEFRYTAPSTASRTVDLRFDNIQLDLTTGGWATGTETSGAVVLYKVADFDGTDNWTDVSPSTGNVPERPHDLAIDLIDSNVVNAYTPDNTTHYRTANGATSWSAIDSTAQDQRVWYTAGTARLRAGTTNIELSLNGTDYSNITGNLATVFSSGYVIKRIQPL